MMQCFVWERDIPYCRDRFIAVAEYAEKARYMVIRQIQNGDHGEDAENFVRTTEPKIVECPTVFLFWAQ